jgi:hypothetical protein
VGAAAQLEGPRGGCPSTILRYDRALTKGNVMQNAFSIAHVQ